MASETLISGPPAGDREGFIAELRATAAHAAADGGGFIAREFEIARHRLRLRFAGPALVEALTPALEHAQCTPRAAPGLTIDIWGGEPAGATMPKRPWAPDDERERGAVRGWFDDEVRVIYSQGSGALSVLEPTRGSALYWVREPGTFPFFERAAPMRALLHLWLAAEGLQLTHGAVLGGPDGCVLIAGPSGAGKSSITLACLDSDIGHLADDYCVLESSVEGRPPVLHALYSSIKAASDSLDRLAVDPSMVANPTRPADDKAVIYLHRHRPDRLINRAPLRAVIVPSISGVPSTRTTEVSQSRALAALAPSTLLQLPETGRPAMSRLADAVRSVPCHRMEVGTDPSGVPAALARILER